MAAIGDRVWAQVTSPTQQYAGQAPSGAYERVIALTDPSTFTQVPTPMRCTYSRDLINAIAEGRIVLKTDADAAAAQATWLGYHRAYQGFADRRFDTVVTLLPYVLGAQMS